MALDHADALVVALGADIFGIGRIDNQKRTVGQAGMEPAHLLRGQVAPGRIVGVGEENHLRPFAGAVEQRVDIGAERRLGRGHGGGAGAARGDGVDEEAVLRMKHLVARAGVGAGEQRDQFVGAVATDNAPGVDPVNLGELGAQRRRPAVGIAVQRAGLGVVGLHRPRTRPARRFVGRQLDRRPPRGPGRRGAAAHIGADLEDAGARNGICHVSRPPAASGLPSGTA